MKQTQIDALNELSTEIHANNIQAGWWTDLKYDDKVQKLKDRGFEQASIDAILEALGIERSTLKTRNQGELLMLVVSEIAEAMEGVRKNLMYDQLHIYKNVKVALADAMIRMFDIAGALGLDLGGAIAEKRAFNASRADHKIENRLKENGKKF